MQDGQFHSPEYKPIFFQPETTSVRLPMGRGIQDSPDYYDNITIANQSGFKNWTNNFFQGVNDTQIGIAGSDLMDGLVKKANSENALAALEGRFSLNDIDEYQYLNEKNKLLDDLSGAYGMINSARSSIAEDEADKKRRPTSKAYQWKANQAMLKGPDASLYEQLGYTLPNVAGSSAATLGATVTAGFVGQLAKNVATRALAGSIGGPVGTAVGVITGLATVFSINAFARNLESKAEIGSQFMADYEQLKGNYLANKEPGHVLSAQEDNDLVLQASLGADEQYWKNMSLAATDSIQSLMFAGAFSKMLKGAANLNKFTRFGSRAGELYVQRKLEGLEEGLQYAFQQQKHRAAFGIKETESFGESLLDDYRDVLSSMNYFGFQGSGKYSKDKEFQASVNAGELLGTFFGGVKTTINLSQDIHGYRSAVKELATLNPTKTEQPILKLKDEIYKQFFGPKNKFLSTQDSQDRLFFFKEGLKTLNKKLDKEGKPFLTREELVQELDDIDHAHRTFSKVSDTIDAIIRPYGVNKATFQLKKSAIRGEIFSNTMTLERAKDTIKARESDVTQAVDAENINPGLSNLAITKANLDIVNKRLESSFGHREDFLKKEKRALEKELKDLQTSYAELEDKEARIPEVNQTTAKALELLIDAKENQFEGVQENEQLKKVKDNKSLDKWFTEYLKTKGKSAIKAHEETTIADNKDFAEKVDRSKDFSTLDENGKKERTKENRDILNRAGYGNTYVDTLTPEQLDLEANKILEEFKAGTPLATEDQVLHTLIDVDDSGKQSLTKTLLDVLLSRPSFRAKFLALGFNPNDPVEKIIAEAFAKVHKLQEERSKNKQRKTRASGTYTGSVGRVKSSLDRRETDDYEKQFGIQEGKAKQRVILESIIASVYSTDSEKELAKKYLELTGEEVVNFGPVKTKEGHPAAGQYNQTDDTVTIDLQYFGDEYEGNIQAIESAILHELTHKYTVATLKSDEGLRQAVRDIMEKAKAAVTTEQFRGLENEFEFVAEVMTSPDFQTFLTKTKGTAKRSLWEEFVNAVSAAIKRVFNIDISGTLLEDSIELTADIIGRGGKVGLVNYATAKAAEIQADFAKIDINSPTALNDLTKVYEDVYSKLLNEINDKPALEGVSAQLTELIHTQVREYEKKIKDARNDNQKIKFKGKTYKQGSFVALKGYNDAFEIVGATEEHLELEHSKDGTVTKMALTDPDLIEFTGRQAEAEYFIQEQKKPKEEYTFTPTAFFKSTGKQIKQDKAISEQLDETERRYYNFLNVLSKSDMNKTPYRGLLIQDGESFGGHQIPHSKETADYLASGGKAGQIVIVVDLNNEVVLFDENGHPSATGKPVVFNIETPETIMKRNSGELARLLELSIEKVNEIKLNAARAVREAREAASKGTPTAINFRAVSGGITVNAVIDDVEVRPMTETEAQNIVNILTFLSEYVNQSLKDFLYHYVEGIGTYDISGGKARNNKVAFMPTAADIMANFRLRKSYKLTKENKPYNVMKVDGKQILVAAQFASYQEYLKTISNLNTSLTQESYNKYIIYEFGGPITVSKPSDIEAKKADIERRREEDLNTIQRYVKGDSIINSLYIPIAKESKRVMIKKLSNNQYEVFSLGDRKQPLPDMPYYDVTKEQLISGVNIAYDTELAALEGKKEDKPEGPKFDDGSLFDTPALRAEKYEELRAESKNFKGGYHPLPAEPDEKTINEYIKLALEDRVGAMQSLGEKAVEILYDWATFNQVYKVYRDKIYLAKKADLVIEVDYLQKLLEAKSETFDTPAKTAVGLSVQSSYYLVRSLDKGVHNYLRKGSAEGEMSYIMTVGEALEDPAFIIETLTEVRKNLLARLNQLKLTRPNDKAIDEKIDLITNKWSDVVNYYIKNSYVFSFDRNLSFLQDETGEVIRDSDDLVAREKGFDRVGNEISPIDGASKEIKGLLRGLSRFKQVDGKWVKVMNEFNVPDLVNFATIYNNLLKNLQGLEGFPEMLERLDSLKETFPEYEELLEILRKYYAYAQIGDVEAGEMIALFKRDIRKPEIPVIETSIESVDGNTTFKIREATRKNVQELKTQFQANFLGKSSYKATTSAGNVVLSPKIVNAATSKKSDRIKFFESLGFQFSKETIEDALFDELTSASVISLFKADIQSLTNAGVLIKEPLTELARPTKVTQGLDKRINSLIDLESRYSRTAPSLSMQNAEGNTEWAISNPNGYTVVIDAINNVKKYPTFQDLVAIPAFAYLNLPYARTSHVLNQIFILDSEVGFGQRRDALNPVTLRLINNSGVVIEGIDGKKTTSLYIGDKIVNDFNQLLKVGYKEGLRAGDKNSAFGIQVTGFYQDGRRLKLPIANFEYFKTGYGGQQMFNIMENYLTGELNRIYLGIHGFLNDVKKIDKNELNRQFSLFDGLLSTEIKNELRAKLRDNPGLEPNSKDLYFYVSGLAKDYISQTAVQNTITDFFRQGAKDKLASFNKYGFSFQNNYWIDDSLKNYSKETLLHAYVVNEFILHVEQTKLVNGDVVFFSNKDGEFHKRIPKDGATGLIPLTDDWWVEARNMDPNNNLQAKLLGINNIYSNAIKTVIFRDSVVPSTYVQVWREYFKAKGYSDAKIDRIVKPYMSNNEADGQGWITMDYYRNFKLSIGSWTKEQEKVYEKLSKGEELTVEEVEKLSRVFPAIKAQYAGPVEHPYYHVPGFHKFSLMPLIPSMIANTNLSHLNERMLRNNVGYALLESGSKSGSVGEKFETFYADNKKSTRLMKDPTLPFETYNIIHSQFFKEQVQFEPEIHEEVIYGTQFRKLLFQNVYSEGVTSYTKFAKLEKEYSSVIEDLTNFLKINLIEELGLDPVIEGGKAVDYKIINEEKFVKKLQKEVEKRKLNLNIQQFFQIENGKLKYDLDASQNNQQIRNVIMSMINSRLVRQTTKGDMMIQGSSLGFEGFTNPTPEERLEYGTNGLRFYHVAGGKVRAMQVKVPLIGDFKHLLNFQWKGKKIGTLANLNQAIKDPEWMNENRRAVTMLGYRIPTQGLNSIEFMEIAEFLPSEAGNIIIVPTEIVTKSGSDFDIDKLNIFKPAIKYDKESDNAYYVEKTKEKVSETKIRKVAQGVEIFERQKEVQKLIDEVTVRLKDQYSEADNTLLVGLKADLADLEQEYNQRFDEFEAINDYKNGLQNRIIELGVQRLEDENSFEELLTPNSTDLIKPIAENELGVKAKTYRHTVNFTSLTQEEKYLAGLPNKRALGIAAVANTFSQLLEANELELNKEFKGRGVIHPMLKSKVHSLSNKMLENDVLKSEVISQMINAYVDVLNDDFISKANLSFDTAGYFFYLLHLGHNHEQLFFFFNHPVVKDLIARSQQRNSLIIKHTNPKYQKDVMRRFNFAKVANLNLAGQGGNKSFKALKAEAGASFDNKYFTIENLKSKLNKPLSELSNEERRSIAFYLDNIMEESEVFLNLQQMNNYDTSTSVNPIAHDYREYLKSVVQSSGLFKGDIESPTSKTVIKPFNQYALISAVLNQLMTVSLSDQVREGIIDLIKEYEDNFDVDLDHDRVTRVLINDWIFYVNANYGKTKDGKTLGEYGKSLLFGNEMAVQLVQFKTDPKWSKLRDNFPIVDQFRVDKEGDVTNISLYRDDNSTDYQNNLIDQFYSLGNYEEGTSEENLIVKRFFRNLAVLGFAQAGLNKGPFYFTDIIPNEFYVPLMHDAIQIYKGLTLKQKAEAFNDFFLRFKGQNPTLFGFAQNPLKTWRFKNYTSQVNTPAIISKSVEGINISTKSEDPLGRALTNPTWGSVKDGKNYYDVETEYKKGRTGDLAQDKANMQALIEKKLRQNPELIDEIDARGGREFLENSSHTVGVKGSRWEGHGTQSNFIQVLIAAYEAVKGVPKQGLTFEEDQSTGYAARTAKNASADATIAIAMDFTSAGETLTKKTVKDQGKLYIGINYAGSMTPSQSIIDAVVERLNKVNAKTLNIAGNGIYTMKGKATQDQVDEYTYKLLKAVTEHPNLINKIQSVRTGGQTGFDEAGAKAGMRLGIPTLILAPKGWKFRNAAGQDISNETQFKARFQGPQQGDQLSFFTPARKSEENVVPLQEGTYNSILKTLLEQGVITPFCE